MIPNADKNRLWSSVSNRRISEHKKPENRFFVYLVCLYIITWYLQLNGRVGILDAVRFEFLLGFFLSVSALIVVINSKDKSTPIKAPVFLLFSVLLFYTVFSYDRDISFKFLFDKVFKASMLALFFAAFIKSPWSLRLAIGAFLLAMLKITQEGFLGWVTGSLVWENQGIPRLHGSTGLYKHPNSFSGLALGCVPFIFYLFPISSKWQKVLLIVLGVFCAVVIVFTGSRTGYVGAAFLILYFWWQRPSKAKIKGFLAGIIAFIILIPSVPDDYISRFESIFTLEEKEGASSEKRIQILEDAVLVFMDKPWGVGVAAFPAVRNEMFGRKQDTHNMYLELLTNMSILGVAAFLFLISRLISVNKRLQKSLLGVKENRRDVDFLVALSKAVIAFVLLRMVLGIFGMDTYEIYWWFAAGLTISIYRCSERMVGKNKI